MIITSPGFYTSKAGKCEVVYVHRHAAFGFDPCTAPAVWSPTGYYNGAAPNGDRRLDITGPFVEPRKPVEAWAADTHTWIAPKLFNSCEEASSWIDHYYLCSEGRPRLVHLREVEAE